MRSSLQWITVDIVLCETQIIPFVTPYYHKVSTLVTPIWQKNKSDLKAFRPSWGSSWNPISLFFFLSPCIATSVHKTPDAYGGHILSTTVQLALDDHDSKQTYRCYSVGCSPHRVIPYIWRLQPMPHLYRLSRNDPSCRLTVQHQ